MSECPEVQQRRLSAKSTVSSGIIVSSASFRLPAENICPTGPLLSASRPVSGLSFGRQSQIADLAERTPHFGAFLSAEPAVLTVSIVREAFHYRVAEYGTGAVFVAILIIFFRSVAISVIKGLLGTGSLEIKARWLPKSESDPLWYENQSESSSMATGKTFV